MGSSGLTASAEPSTPTKTTKNKRRNMVVTKEVTRGVFDPRTYREDDPTNWARKRKPEWMATTGKIHYVRENCGVSGEGAGGGEEERGRREGRVEAGRSRGNCPRAASRGSGENQRGEERGSELLAEEDAERYHEVQGGLRSHPSALMDIQN